MTPMTNIAPIFRRVLLALLLLPSFVLAQGNSIDTLQVGQHEGQTVVKIGLRQALTAPPSSFSVADPARIVFDFPQASNGLGRNVQEVDQGELRSVNIVQAGDRTRLVLNLKKMAPFETKLEGGFVLVTLQSAGALATPVAVADKPTQHFPEVKSKVDQEHSIRDVTFRRGATGEGVVTIDLTDANTGIDVRQQGSNLIVDFQKTKLPENLRRKMDVMDFATPVTAVTTSTVGNNVRVTIAPTGLWEHAAYQSDNQFVLQVKPLKEDPNKLFQGSQQRGYQGEKISLNFQNIPLRELLYVFADITGFNIVVADNVAGNVSLRLNDVPWDQALEIVMQQQNLAMRKNGNVMQIGRAADLTRQEEDALKARQAIGDIEPTKTESIQINYQKADAISKLLTDAKQPVLSKRGTAVVDAYTNRVFVTDTPTRLNAVRELITAIDIPARQVLIEAKFVVARKTFGLNLGARVSFLNEKDTFLRRRDPSILAANAANPMSFQPGYSGGNTFRFALFNADATRIINLELQASEVDTTAKTISSPRVVAENNAPAKISSGTTYYMTIPASGNTQASSVTIDATLALTVTPQITPDGRVKMRLQVQDKSLASAPTIAGADVNTREISTDATVDNGGTLVLGGVSKVESTERVDKVPFLGDLPILGALFRTKNTTSEDTELLVFITPRILDQKIAF
ncbi:type IV pilus secretin family protein [Sulfurisoma sediminicola]|nr:type IV pilus secretin family protein [Sulfurisoma sediminicola]